MDRELVVCYPKAIIPPTDLLPGTVVGFCENCKGEIWVPATANRLKTKYGDAVSILCVACGKRAKQAEGDGELTMAMLHRQLEEIGRLKNRVTVLPKAN